MNCPRCGAAAQPNARFCSECGNALSASCRTCGSALVEGSKFCAQCGTPVAATTGATTGATNGPTATAAIGPQPSATNGPVAERRLVSVVFADLVGFTTLAEGRDAEETRDLLSRYFELAGDIIGRYGGTIEKFIGDAVMAVWGAPIARENDAERAVRAALDLVDAVRSLGQGLSARAGVLTGEAAVTIGATNQGMVAGDLVNTASRLQSAAAPGTVLVGETTERAANQAIAFEPAGDQVLKGKAVPVPAFRAIRVVAERGGRGRADQLEAPFVGRDDELRLLKDLFHATGRERRTRIVSITGVAGSGKSRMAWELSKYLDGVVERAYWHTGRSPAYGEGITFWALGEMVRGRAGLAETDDESTTRAKVAETVERWIPDEPERRWVEGALLALLGTDVGTGMGRDELFSAWRTFFERIAEKGTAILVFEDLHWADPGTLDFIDHLVEWSRGAPILVVTLARPELFERRPQWGAGRRNFLALSLEPLPGDAIRGMLSGLAPSLPEQSIRAIIERADGIPLYAVETIRMLLAEGRLAVADGVYVPAGDLSSLAVPETLHALIAARLDALGTVERGLIQDAAVLGQSFTPEGLAAVSGLEQGQVEDMLRGLVRRELLVHNADSRSPERGQYAFVQALIREVAYGTLARRDRRSRHLAAARFFEALGEDELAGALASHYLAAYRAAPDDPDSQPLAAQAKIALRAAASRAATLGSHDQAITFLVEAVEVTDDPAEIAELLERAGEAAIAAARTDRAETLLRDSIARREALGDRRGAARSTALLGQALAGGWRTRDAIELLNAAVATYGDLENDSALASIEHQLARAYWLTNEGSRALEIADRALGRAERLEVVPLIADALITKGSLLNYVGRAYEGIAAQEAGIRLAEEQGRNQTLVRGLLNQGVALIGRDPRLALERSRTAYSLASKLGFRGNYAIALGNSGEVAVSLGEWDWALTATSEAFVEDLEPGDRASILRTREEILAARGEPVEGVIEEHWRLIGTDATGTERSNIVAAQAAVDFAAGRFREAADGLRLSAADNSANIPTDLPRAGRALVWLGDTDGLREIVTMLENSGVRGRVMDVHLRALRAAIAALAGQRDEAAAEYVAALGEFAELGLVFDQALTALDMARALGTEATAVRTALAEARTILERLGARPYLERLDELESGSARTTHPTTASTVASG
jgi:class 3 adenylate cyclase/tetratricopeptide (TPR) repeat protein